MSGREPRRRTRLRAPHGEASSGELPGPVGASADLEIGRVPGRWRYAAGLWVLLHYRRRLLRGDVLAGVTVAAYLIPQVMALFYYLRRDAAGFSTFGTIDTSGAVTDRFGVGNGMDALAFAPANLGYGSKLFYYLRHDAAGFSTFGTIDASGAVTDRFGVGNRFEALTFASGNRGFGPNRFY